ncbi:hypothetical protein PXH59_03420 [Xenorhabdus sp. SF857]|nr:hypothetical protein [Xenorhabdus sp. SF857]WFQ80230.1 hypothetical protein PXH59_03420 [Xenorhabdus sp. SF857]
MNNVINPFGSNAPQAQPTQGMVAVEQQRAIQETRCSTFMVS